MRFLAGMLLGGLLATAVGAWAASGWVHESATELLAVPRPLRLIYLQGFTDAIVTIGGMPILSAVLGQSVTAQNLVDSLYPCVQGADPDKVIAAESSGISQNKTLSADHAGVGAILGLANYCSKK